MKKLLLAFVSACTSATGVTPTVELVDMTDEEIEDECEYLSEEYPHKKLSCGSKSQVFGFGSKASCVQDLRDADASHAACKATIGDLDDCMAYLYAMTCDDAGQNEPDSCKRVFSTTCD